MTLPSTRCVLRPASVRRAPLCTCPGDRFRSTPWPRTYRRSYPCRTSRAVRRDSAPAATNNRCTGEAPRERPTTPTSQRASPRRWPIALRAWGRPSGARRASSRTAKSGIWNLGQSLMSGRPVLRNAASQTIEPVASWANGSMISSRSARSGSAASSRPEISEPAAPRSAPSCWQSRRCRRRPTMLRQERPPDRLRVWSGDEECKRYGVGHMAGCSEAVRGVARLTAKALQFHQPVSQEGIGQAQGDRRKEVRRHDSHSRQRRIAIAIARAPA